MGHGGHAAVVHGTGVVAGAGVVGGTSGLGICHMYSKCPELMLQCMHKISK